MVQLAFGDFNQKPNPSMASSAEIRLAYLDKREPCNALSD